MIVFRFLVATFALLLIIGGAVLTISPIPGGIFIFLMGLIVFAAAVPKPVRALRKRWRWFDRFMHRIERFLPKFIARRLKESDWEHPDEKDEHDKEDEKSAKRRQAERRRR